MIKGWRTTFHYWSRRGDFLKKTAFILVLASFTLSWLTVSLSPERAASVTLNPLEQKIRQDWRNLKNAPSAQPRELTQWLRVLLSNLDALAEALAMPQPTLRDYEKSGELLTFAVKPLIIQHASAAEANVLMEDYLCAYLGEKSESAQKATQRLFQQAQLPKPPAFANELAGSLLLKEKDEAGALVAYMREGTLFQEAQQAREKASYLALKIKDEETLQAIVKAGWLKELPPSVEHLIGAQIRDLTLEWRGLLRSTLSQLQYHHLALTLLASLLWYIILVQHMSAGGGRWLWPVLPLMAGIASIWPTLSLVYWQKEVMGITDDVAFPYDLWHLIIGVGLREEVCKLALAAIFMPWLIWKRLPGGALMTGAFVGLGFALEENLGYYDRYEGGSALVRFLTANFMHVAMTGLTTHALYDMLRSRFNRVQEFLIVFSYIVIAHAVYDYDFDLPGIQGLSGYTSYVILGFLAWRFWDQVEMEIPHARQLIAPAAIFMLGTALVMACSFFLSVYSSGTHEALISTAQSCVSSIIVAFIHWRRFDGDLIRR